MLQNLISKLSINRIYTPPINSAHTFRVANRSDDNTHLSEARKKLQTGFLKDISKCFLTCSHFKMSPSGLPPEGLCPYAALFPPRWDRFGRGVVPGGLGVFSMFFLSFLHSNLRLWYFFWKLSRSKVWISILNALEERTKDGLYRLRSWIATRQNGNHTRSLLPALVTCLYQEECPDNIFYLKGLLVWMLWRKTESLAAH